MQALATIVSEYTKHDIESNDSVNTSSYNPEWFYSIKYHKETGLIVGIHGSEYDGLDYFPALNETDRYDTVYLGKIAPENFEAFKGYELSVLDTFVKYNRELGTFSVFKINVICSGEYIQPMDAYYSETGEFDIQIKIENLTEQLKETVLEGFYIKDMSKGEIAISGMTLEDNGYKTAATKNNPKFKAVVKNLDGDDTNQVLRVRAKFLGGDDIDMNPNTITKYIMLLTKKPSDEELALWTKKLIRKQL
jgi:hypothetical protein